MRRLYTISYLICNRTKIDKRRGSIRSWGNNKNEKSEKSALLDLTADGDVFVPDRRLGRLRRLIDSFFPLFACVAPDRVLCFLSFSLFPLVPLFILLIFPLPATLRLFLSHNLQSLPKSEGGTSRPVVVIRVFVGAPINRFTAQRLWTSRGPASSRHTIIKFKVASLTDSRSPFVSNLAGRSKDLDDVNAVFGLDWASLLWII